MNSFRVFGMRPAGGAGRIRRRPLRLSVRRRHSRAKDGGPGYGLTAKVLIEVAKRGQRAIESVTFRRGPAGAAHPAPSRRVREKIDQALREHSGVSGREEDTGRFLV